LGNLIPDRMIYSVAIAIVTRVRTRESVNSRRCHWERATIVMVGAVGLALKDLVPCYKSLPDPCAPIGSAPALIVLR